MIPSTMMTDCLTVFFVPLGSARAKAVHKMLAKSTPVGPPFITFATQACLLEYFWTFCNFGGVKVLCS